MTEAGPVGVGCARPKTANDVHFVKDRLGLIVAPRSLPGTGDQTDVFFLTSLTPSTPKVLLNFDSGDSGVVEKRRCDCLLEEVGLDEHILDVSSV